MIRWLVHRPTTVAVVAFAVLVFGLLSYITLPRESSPDITIPVVLVTTPYIGVSPQDVEKLVTVPLENELAGLQDIKEMSSTSAEGVSIISIEFDPSVNIDEALTNTRDRVSRAEADLPDDAEESSVSEISFSDIPIMLVNIAGDVDEEVLKKLGEDLEDTVVRIPGVLEANLSGGQEREIQVNVDPLRLSHYGLSFNDVISAIGNEDVNIPGGEVDSGSSTFLVRTPGDFEDPLELASVPIKRVGDRPVFVRDVATVYDGFADRDTLARMNGEPSVSLAVKKRPGSNIIEIADEVKALVAAQSETWPEGVNYRVLSDESFYIRDQVSSLQNNILTALILVVGVIFFFMGGRNSLLVALAIPFSLLISMMVLDILGFTLNMMVLFSLILALGMLVDNAIVVVENIYRHVEEGLTLKEAATKGADEVAIAVFASTMTTVAAFFPLVFWGGIMGEFMGFLPKTVIIVLVSSLFVAVFFLPTFSGMFMKRSAAFDPDADHSDHSDEAPVGRVMSLYRGFLRFSIGHRYLSAGAMVFALMLSIVAYAILGAGLEFFPETDPDQATISVRAPDGTDVMATDRIARRIEAILASEENVDVFVTEVGVASSGSGSLGGSQSASNQARISVDFLKDRNAARGDEKVRVESTTDTIARLRARMREIPGAAISVEKREMGPPVEMPIKVQVVGENMHEVGEFAQRVRREIAKIEGATELTDDYRVGRPELQLRVDRGAAKRVGVSTAEVGNTVRTAVAGATASTLRDGEDEYDITVRLAPEYRNNLQSVLDLRIAGREDTSPDTFPVPLSAVARYELAGGTGSVRHVDQELVVTIEGDVLDGYADYDIQQQVAALLPTLEEEGFHLEMVGSNAEQEEAGAFLLRALAIAVALIMMVLVAQFDSLSTPLIIIATVGLSMIGVLWGLILTQTAFGVIMTGIGVISLAGVVVNNAIVLLDYVGQLRSEGVPMDKALVRAGMTRFRPVMLTAATTVLGLVPMAVGISFDFTRFRFLIGGSSQQFWAPMAVAVIFGLAFATVLTLVMVPTLYTIFDDVGRLRRYVFSGGRSTKVVEATAKLLLVGVVAGAAVQSAQAVTLDQAFASAEANNLDLAVVQEQTEQARATVGQAWSVVQPRVTGQLGLTINEFEVEVDFTEGLPPALQPEEPPEPVVIQQKTQWAGNVTVSQQLFNGEAIPTLRGAYALRRAAEADEAGTRQQIRAGVASSFYGLATAREAVGLAEESLAVAESQLELATRRNAAGLEPNRSVIQARLAVSQSRRDVDAAAEQLVRAEESFHRVTGLERDVELELPDLSMAPVTVDDAMATATTARLDLEAARLRVAAAERQVAANRWGWAPTIDANFSYIYQEASGFTGQNTFWQAGITGRWTLWDGGLRLAQSREAVSQRRVAELALRTAEDQATEDIRVAWEAYERAQDNAELVADEVELAQESLRLAEAGLQAGTSTWLEVEQARILLRQTQLSDLQERMTRDLAAIELQRAMGTL